MTEQLKTEREALQAEGRHPAPCVRFCEATAFKIEIQTLNHGLRQKDRRIEELEAQLARASQAQEGWQPIETAPKDKRVLVWSGKEIYAAHWAQSPYTGDEAWIVAEWGDDREQALVKPTHWKPIGAAPAGGETENK